MPPDPSQQAWLAAVVIENAREYAIFSTDLQRRVTSWNTGAERLLGFSEHEAMGETADFIFTPEDRAAGAPEREARTALADGRASDERFHQRKDGSRFWASGVLMRMHDPAGNAVGFVKILRDQTEVRATQQALEQADAAKDRFLAVLSHELRNPLAAIDSAAALLTAAETSPEDRGAAALVVARQAAAMMILLDDLLDISRLTLGRLVLQREPVRLAEVVDRALESVRPMLAAARHSLSIDLPPRAVMLDADPVRLAQVFSNLLTNAARYTPPGGTITLRARTEGAEVAVTVSDNGIGMDPAQIEEMFEMFAQGRTDSGRSAGGLGIGLALARSIAQLHGGRLSAHSGGAGLGSEFTVRLPIQRASAALAAMPPTQPPRPAPTRPGWILVADDNADAAWGMSRLLEVAGYATVVVRSGQEAVAEASRRMPSVAILDIGMPDLSGHEVARKLRAMPGGEAVVLIAVTGWGQATEEQASLAAGFDAHMTKPVNLRKLSALVDGLMERRQRTKPA